MSREANLNVPKYTKEQEEWLRTLPPLNYTEEGGESLAKAVGEFKERFNVERTDRALVQKQKSLLGSVKSRKQKRSNTSGVKVGRGRSKPTKYTPEMDGFLRSLAVDKKMSWTKKAKTFNAQFGCKIRRQTLRWHWYRIHRQVEAGLLTSVVEPAVKAENNISNGFHVVVNGKTVWSGQSKPQVIVQQSTTIVGF